MKAVRILLKALVILVLAVSIIPCNVVSALGEETALQIKPVYDFNLVWWDKGSGGVHDGSYYKPVLPNGYFAVGYYGQSNYNKPNGFVYAVKPLKADAIASPTGYTKVWNDRGSGAYMDGYFWEPIPPDGYISMGMVVTNGTKPSVNEVVCIKKEYVLKANTGTLVWDDTKTGSIKDFGSWRINAVTDGVSPGTFFGITSHKAPIDNKLLWCFNAKYTSTPVMEIKPVYNFSLAWWDKGSGGVHDGAFYDPIIPKGYYAVGCYGQSNYNKPTEPVYVIKPYKSDCIANPIGYTKVWNDRGSGADANGCFWKPIPPDGYVAMGMVVTNGSEPSNNAVVCIKKDYVLKANTGTLVWDDTKTGSIKDFGSWRIKAVTGGVSPGTFFGITSHTPPGDDDLLWCFKYDLLDFIN